MGGVGRPEFRGGYPRDTEDDSEELWFGRELPSSTETHDEDEDKEDYYDKIREASAWLRRIQG